MPARPWPDLLMMSEYARYSIRSIAWKPAWRGSAI